MTSVPTRATGTKHVLVICQLDAYANGVKPVEIQRFLRQLGHDVRLVDTYHLSRSRRAPGRFAGRLPAPSPRKAALYATEATAAVLTRRWRFGRSHLSYYLLLADHRLRRAILKRALPLDDYDLVICETIYDAGVLAEARSARTLYDAPAPWADEVYFDGRVTDRQHRKLRRLETAIFEGVDHLALHWDSYARYAVEHYRISGHNLMSLNFGCVPAPRRADFATPPRVVYLGNVTAGFNNPALLSRLSRLYPRIDVYGGPRRTPRSDSTTSATRPRSTCCAPTSWDWSRAARTSCAGTGSPPSTSTTCRTGCPCSSPPGGATSTCCGARWSTPRRRSAPSSRT